MSTTTDRLLDALSLRAREAYHKDRKLAALLDRAHNAIVLLESSWENASAACNTVAGERDRLRDENESLRGSLEEWKLDLNSLRDENAKLSALLLWALYHHQGGSSEVGQPIRRALGIGQYDDLTPSQIKMAKSAAAMREGK